MQLAPLEPLYSGASAARLRVRVLSNLSFTAKFDVNKTPDFERNQGFCDFWGKKNPIFIYQVTRLAYPSAFL